MFSPIFRPWDCGRIWIKTRNRNSQQEAFPGEPPEFGPPLQKITRHEILATHQTWPRKPGLAARWTNGAREGGIRLPRVRVARQRVNVGIYIYIHMGYGMMWGASL